MNPGLISAGPYRQTQDGCLFCGIGHQMPADAVAGQSLMSIARGDMDRETDADHLTGRQLSAGSVSGYLCSICADAHAHVHSIGPTALERAFVAALAPEGIGKLDYDNLVVDDLMGWGGLVAEARLADPAGVGPEPNSRPWSICRIWPRSATSSDGGWASEPHRVVGFRGISEPSRRLDRGETHGRVHLGHRHRQ